MAEISWIKLKTTMFDDEKIRLIQAVPESDAILVIWIRLLVLAGKTNDDGLIYIQRNMPYTEEMLSTLFGKNVNTVRLALNTLASFNMIDLNTDGLIAITNWEKHQNIEGMERIREQNRLRAKKHYDKKKNSNVSLTLPNATDIDIDKELDIDIDKDKEINKEINKENPPENKKANKKPVKNSFGEFENVLLTQEEYDKLQERFSYDLKDRIERLSSYVASSGKKYKSHYATIIAWSRKDKPNPNTQRRGRYEQSDDEIVF